MQSWKDFSRSPLSNNGHHLQGRSFSSSALICNAGNLLSCYFANVQRFFRSKSQTLLSSWSFWLLQITGKICILVSMLLALYFDLLILGIKLIKS